MRSVRTSIRCSWRRSESSSRLTRRRLPFVVTLGILIQSRLTTSTAVASTATNVPRDSARLLRGQQSAGQASPGRPSRCLAIRPAPESPKAEAAGLQPAPICPLAHSDSRLFVGTSSLARRWQARAGSAQRRQALAAAGGSVRHLACNSPTPLSHPPHPPARRLTPSPSLKGIALRAIRHVGARLGFPPGFGGRSSTGLPACLRIPQCFALGRCRRPAPTPEARSFRFAEVPRLQRRVAPVRRARPCRDKPGTYLASAAPGVVSVASAAGRRLRLPLGRLHAGPPGRATSSLYGSRPLGRPPRAKPAGAGCRSRAPLDAAPFRPSWTSGRPRAAIAAHRPRQS